MEELRIAFLVIGSVFIVGVLVHGIWKMRRQNDVPERQTPARIEPTTHSEKDTQGFDELGLGEVRVIASGAQASEENDEQDDVDIAEPEATDPVEMAIDDDLSITASERVEISTSVEVDSEQDQAAAPLYANVVTQPKPHLNEPAPVSASTTEEAIPEPPEFLLKEEKPEQAEPDFGLSATPAAPTPAPKTDSAAKKTAKKRAPAKRRKEPTLGEDQMRIDFDEPEIKVQIETKPKKAPAVQSQEQEVLVINVRAPEESTLSGAALLPLLLTLGFKFGDHDIFHRHVNANGKGPVLFSLANMVKPGVFDIDNLETFTTQGISLFMVLPIDGDPHQVFNMMHNAARKIADEFGAQLLDGRRSILTKQGIQQYVEKIREFERQRIISKSSL